MPQYNKHTQAEKKKKKKKKKELNNIVILNERLMKLYSTRVDIKSRQISCKIIPISDGKAVKSSEHCFVRTYG